MGFRFRKTVRLGRLIRLNFSGSGVSLGLGPRGANVNLSRRGVRQTVGLPGTGLSYQTFTKWRSPPPSLPPAPEPEATSPTATGRDRQYTGFLKFVGAFALVTFLAAILGLANNKPKAPISSTASTAPAMPPAMAAGPEAREQAAPSVAKSVTPLPLAPNTPLTADEMRELQTWLKAFGLDAGPIDGLMGPLTTSAIKKYEVARVLPVTGNADRPLLERLRKDTGGAIR